MEKVKGLKVFLIFAAILFSIGIVRIGVIELQEYRKEKAYQQAYKAEEARLKKVIKSYSSTTGSNYDKAMKEWEMSVGIR